MSIDHLLLPLRCSAVVSIQGYELTEMVPLLHLSAHEGAKEICHPLHMESQRLNLEVLFLLDNARI